MSKPLLEVRQVVKRFGGLTAVDNVSFEVEAGRIIGVIGPKNIVYEDVSSQVRFLSQLIEEILRNQSR